MKDPLIKAGEVKNRYSQIWMGLDCVTAVGTGITSNGKPGIIISMEKEDTATRNIFPPEIEGIPVEVKITGEIDAE